MPMIPIVVVILGTIPKGLDKGTEDLEIRVQEETIPTTTLLRAARILRRVLKTWGDCCHSKPWQKPSANAGVKNSQENNKNKTQNSLVFWDINRSLNPNQKTRTYVNNQVEKTFHEVDFAVAADYSGKMEENEKNTWKWKEY